MIKSRCLVTQWSWVYTLSGHYCVSLCSCKQLAVHGSTDKIPEVLLIDENTSTADRKKILIKLHKQFGHASADRLQNLLKDAGTNDQEVFKMLKEVVAKCGMCFKSK